MEVSSAETNNDIPSTLFLLIRRLSIQGIIEGDQIQVAAFSLEYFSGLTGLTLGQ